MMEDGEHPFLTEEQREMSVVERRNRERGTNAPVENEETIPLFPSAKTDAKKTIHEIQVWKRDPPGEGYKGTVSPSTGLQAVSTLYGNGLYDFFAVTQDGKILRRNTAVKLAFTSPEAPTKSESTSIAGGTDMNLLQWQAQQHAKETERVESFGKMSMDTTRAHSSEQLAAMREQAAAAAQRDREFFAGMIQQQQQAFQNMMMMAQQSHTQDMERQRETSRMMLETMQTSHERIAKATDPSLYLGLFREGMTMARLSAPGESEPAEDPGVPWVQAIQAGAAAVSDIASVSKMKAIAEVSRGKRPVVAASAKPTKAAQHFKRRPVVTPAPEQEGPAIEHVHISEEEKADVLNLKKLMDEKGLDFSEMVRNAGSYFTEVEVADDEAPPESAPESAPEDAATSLAPNDGADSEPAEGGSEEAATSDVA